MSFTKTAVFISAVSMAGFLFAAGDPKVSPADDYLELPEDCMATEFAVGAAVAEDEGAITVVAPEEASFTVTCTGLPKGLKYDAKVRRITGVPTAPGIYFATVSAKNANGFTASRVVRASVSGFTSDLAELSVTELEFAYAEEDVEESVYVSATDAEHPVKSLKVSGLPSGLKAKTYVDDGEGVIEITGSPKKSGLFAATVSATLAGVSKAAQLTLLVSVANQDELITDLDLTDLAVGDDIVEFLDGGVVSVGADGDITKVSVSGLPAGIKATASVSEGIGFLTLSGSPTKTGRYAVTISATYMEEGDNGRKKSVTRKSVYDVTVQSSSSAYVYGEAEGAGKVVGAKVYADGAKVSLRATADRGNVFTGWFADDGEGNLAPAEVPGVDYRNPALAFSRVGEARSYGKFVARFAATSEDSEVKLSAAEDNWEWELNVASGEVQTFAFAVESASLPKITAKGLPSGVKFAATSGGGVLTYTPGRTAPKPGRYAVTLTAVNQSKATASSVATVIVGNVENETFREYGLNQDNDGYTVAGGISSTAIDLSEMVDDGWKVTASGLPAGFKMNADGTVTGLPTKAGSFTVTFTARRGSTTTTATAFLTVGQIPALAVGTFNGFVYAPGEDEPSGTFTFTATATGKLTAKAVTAAGATTWSANGWTDADEAAYVADIVQIKKSGKVSITNSAVLAVSLVDVGYDDFQLSGALDFGDGEEWTVTAQRNPYGKSGKSYEYPDAVAAVNAIAGTYLIDENTGAKATVAKTTGAAKLSAKIEGKTVSASSFVFWTAGQPWVGFVPMLKVGAETMPVSIKYEIDYTPPDSDD